MNNKFTKENNKLIDLKYLLVELNYEIDIVPLKSITWFGYTRSVIDYSNKYIIDMDMHQINIYKKKKKRIVNVYFFTLPFLLHSGKFLLLSINNLR